MTDKDSLAKKASEIAQRTTAKKEAPAGKGIVERIARASIDVGSFLPDRDNTHQNYKYISANQIADRCGDALAREGVVILPDITSLELFAIETSKGTKMHSAKIEILFHVSTDTKEDTLNLRWYSVGVDSASPDKALAKAITTGMKYFTMKLLQVGVGNEDAEHENHSDEDPQRDLDGNRLPVKVEELELDKIASQIKTEKDFLKACRRYMNVGTVEAVEALGDFAPAAWLKAQKGRTIREALQRVLDYSITEAERDLAD